jgi:uncharacterized protein
MSPIIDAHLHCSEMKEDGLAGYAAMSGLRYTLDELLFMMKENNVMKGLLLSPPTKSGAAIPNQKIVELCERSNGMLFPVLTVEPRKTQVEGALRLAKRIPQFVKAFKIRLGYVKVYASHKIFDRVYDYAEGAGIPVMFHTGDTATSDGSLKHSHPLTLDPVANKRPDLKIVSCHFGNPWIPDVGELLYKHENFYADISGLVAGGENAATYAQKYMESLAQKISEAIYYADGAKKVLFGTDYPVETFSNGIALTNLLKIGESDRNRILYDNAKELFFK